MIECRQLNVAVIFIGSVTVIFSILKIGKCNTKAILAWPLLEMKAQSIRKLTCKANGQEKTKEPEEKMC